MERISAFIDGEVSRNEANWAILRLEQDAECLETWKTFTTIGEVMRGEAGTFGNVSPRVHATLEHEPTVLAPRHALWRRKSGSQVALSIAASVAGIGLVLTLILTDNPLNPQAQIAAIPAQQQVTVPMPGPVPAANQARVQEYLMAHQEFSSSTPLQGVAPYVRTVSEPINGGN